jgi:hypothetical protein
MCNTSLDDFNTIKPQIDKMSEDDTVSINMPFKHYMQECMLAYERLRKCREYLEKNKMDFTEVLKIPVILGACREIFSLCSMINFPTPASKKEWEKAKEEADLLMYDLKAAMDYAFQEHPELLSQVSAIRQGSSNADYIQDFNDAYVLCRENRALLENIHYDMGNIERASVLAKELSRLLALATLDKSNSPELRINRDKCFTILKKTIDAAFKQARYIYRNDKKTSAQFMINPPMRKAGKAVKTEGETK